MSFVVIVKQNGHFQFVEGDRLEVETLIGDVDQYRVLRVQRLGEGWTLCTAYISQALTEKRPYSYDVLKTDKKEWSVFVGDQRVYSCTSKRGCDAFVKRTLDRQKSV